jgi:LysR family transcriptional regulator, transcriptional activator for dmlA
MNTLAHAPSDMAFFSLLARMGSLSATAREMGMSTAAISKRLAQMELRLGVPLVSRTTRRLHLTAEGELYLAQARRILADIEALAQQVQDMRAKPQGPLRINATLGFGRMHIAPLIARFVALHPEVHPQLQLSVEPPPLVDDSFDVCIRFGEPPDARMIARKLAANQRLLCAAPRYLAQHGTPQQPSDLRAHHCIDIRQGDAPYGVWRLLRDGKTDNVRLRDGLSTNDGEIAVSWALAGLGIVKRAQWDVARYLHSGRLVQVLADYNTPHADVYAVYHPRHQSTARVQAFVNFVLQHFAQAQV